MRVVLTTAFLALGGHAAAQEGPSFDCAAASGEMEKVVCSTPELAQLDRELARLYGLAADGRHMTPERKRELVATQRGWIKGRDDRWKETDRPACIKREYVTRIGELRQAYADARSDDGAGISLGPFGTTCAGLDAGIGTVFVNSDPGAVYLAWLENVVVLDHAISGSGARYEGADWQGRWQFWNKGDAATLEGPGLRGTLDCMVGEDPGSTWPRTGNASTTTSSDRLLPPDPALDAALAANAAAGLPAIDVSPSRASSSSSSPASPARGASSRSARSAATGRSGSPAPARRRPARHPRGRPAPRRGRPRQHRPRRPRRRVEVLPRPGARRAARARGPVRLGLHRRRQAQQSRLPRLGAAGSRAPAP